METIAWEKARKHRIILLKESQMALVARNPPTNTGDPGSILLGRAPKGGDGNLHTSIRLGHN